MTRRRLLIILTAIAAVSAASGCWNRREIETVGFITGAGLDLGPDGQILVTVHIAKPFAIGGETGTRREKPFWVVTTAGKTTFEAIRNLLAESPRRPFWQHNRFILIGEELARKGIKDAIDFFYRDGETRTTATIVIAKGTTARELLQAEFQLEPLPAEGGFGILQGERTGLSKISPLTLQEFLQALEGEGVEPVSMGSIVIDEDPSVKNKDIGADLLRDTILSRLRATGGALFKGDQLVGWLDDLQTRGLLWITGRARSSIVVVTQPGHEDKYVGLEILRSTSSTTPRVAGDKVVVNVDISTEANLGDVQEDIDPDHNPKEWTDLEQRLASTIQQEALSAIQVAQDLGADVFGFGRALSKKSPGDWQRLKDSWDEEFRKIEVQVNVRAKLRRLGLFQRAVRVK